MASAAAPAVAGEDERIGVVERRIARAEIGSPEDSKTVLLFDQAVPEQVEAVEPTLRRASETYRDHLKDGWSKAHAAACGSIDSSFGDNDPGSTTAPMISENGSMVFFWGMGWRGTEVSHPSPVRRQGLRGVLGEWFQTPEGAMSSEIFLEIAEHVGAPGNASK